MKKLSTVLMVAVVVMLLAFISPAKADVPQIINYQGSLTTAGGTPITGCYDFRFSIYTQLAGGSSIWGIEDHLNVAVDKGSFSVLLGAGGPPLVVLDDTHFSDSIRYLQIDISPCGLGTYSAIAPRTRLTTVPYAFRVATVDGATGGAIYGDLDLHSDYTVWGDPSHPSRWWRISHTSRADITTSNDLVFKPGGAFAVVVQNSASFWGVGSSESNYILKLNMATQNFGIGVPGVATEKLHVKGSFRLENGSQANNYVLTSDANGVGTWQAPTGGGPDGDWNIVNGGLDLESAVTRNVGIGTSTPGAKLDVELTSGNGGAATMGNNANTATGDFAVAIGSDNQAGGTNSFAAGSYNQAIGFTSVAIGDSNIVSGGISFAIGANDSVDGNYSGAIGTDLAVDVDYSHVIGHGVDDVNRLINSIQNSLMVGYSSDIPTFFVGPSSGLGTTGRVGIGTSTPSAKLDVEVTSGGAATIGSPTNTATGTNAVAMGGGNQASGNNSFAVGSGNKTTAGISMAMGQNNTVTGVHSTAFGWANYVSGDNSFAIGANDTVVGGYSGTIGRDLAIGPVGSAGASHVIGRGASGTNRLTNGTANSLMVGYLSDIPTLYVGPSSGVGTTGKVGIGTTTPQGALDVSSTTGALIVPRMTATQRNALTAVNGMIIYNTITDQFNFYEAGVWIIK